MTYYESGFERNRLKSSIGLIEFERTKEILLEKLPKAPAVIYDIGGALLVAYIFGIRGAFIILYL